jgi:hypothetical protein
MEPPERKSSVNSRQELTKKVYARCKNASRGREGEENVASADLKTLSPHRHRDTEKNN